MSTGRRVLLCATGSRGDCQPYVALARQLQSTGFTVKLCTNRDHVDFARSMGIDAIAVAEDNASLWSDPEIWKAQKAGDFKTFCKSREKIALNSFNEQAKQEIALIQAFKPELMLSGLPDYCFRQVLSHVFDVPLILGALQSLGVSKYKSSVLAEPPWMPGRVHVICGMLSWYFWWKADEVKMKILRRDTKLPGSELYMTGFLQVVYDNGYPLLRPLCAASSVYEVDMPDLEEAQQQIYTGSWVIEASEQEQQVLHGNRFFGGDQVAALDRFLAAGPAPVYVGWGSLVPAQPEDMAKLAVAMLRKLDARGVVLGGTAQLGPKLLGSDPGLVAYAEQRVFFTSSAAHEVLFPRCSVLVHHGGMGTTAAAFRAGRPQVITPVFADQLDNARRVVAAGAGLSRHFKECTANSLSQDVQSCLSDGKIKATCEELGARMRAERGVCRAAELVVQVFRDEIDTGRWREAHGRRKAILTQPKANRHPSCFVWLAKVCCSPRPTSFRHWVE